MRRRLGIREHSMFKEAGRGVCRGEEEGLSLGLGSWVRTWSQRASVHLFIQYVCIKPYVEPGLPPTYGEGT